MIMSACSESCWPSWLCIHTHTHTHIYIDWGGPWCNCAYSKPSHINISIVYRMSGRGRLGKGGTIGQWNVYGNHPRWKSLGLLYLLYPVFIFMYFLSLYFYTRPFSTVSFPSHLYIYFTFLSFCNFLLASELSLKRLWGIMLYKNVAIYECIWQYNVTYSSPGNKKVFPFSRSKELKAWLGPVW